MISSYEAKSFRLGVRKHLDLGVVFGFFRVTKHLVNGTQVKTIDIASIESREEGKGAFTSFISSLEHLAASHGYYVYVESILNPVLERKLKSRGYSFIDYGIGSGNTAWLAPRKRAHDMDFDIY